LLSTGASDTFSKQGIYDLAGNVWEWTLEYTTNPNYPSARRGGCNFNIGAECTATSRNNSETSDMYRSTGFRTALY
jgi:formylglycine-generating sulfatase enzyme